MNITELAIYKKMFGGSGGSGFIVCDDWQAFSSNTIANIEKLKISYPNAMSVEDNAFSGCEKLVAIDLPKATSIGSQAFYSCISLETVILRTTETVCVIDLTAFDESGFLYNLLTGINRGYIYVPAVMYEYYRAGYEQPLASLLGEGAFDRFVRKIEDYPEICNGASVSSGATAYHLPSVDNLPASAKNGSIAIVDTPHALLGTWKFNTVVNIPYSLYNLSFECDGVIYTQIVAYGSIQYILPSGDGVTVYDNGESKWLDDKYRTIKITESLGQEVHGWLTAGNAEQIEPSIAHQIYYRENGEWVYKGTTSEAISAEYY